ncbi:hypothetical protein KG892_00350 [Vermiphilus pyriformis]|jgi:DNA-binding SARP family transcriptional activator|nr:MAG: hypothetical protein KG892_00350 [Vermiphilus pyriformis]
MKKISEKHILAWFTLAECVARNEKERALGMYKLLSHSIEDPAYSALLEADLRLSFGDTQYAYEKYAQAVQLYAQSGRVQQAQGVYDHLHQLDNHTDRYEWLMQELTLASSATSNYKR